MKPIPIMRSHLKPHDKCPRRDLAIPRPYILGIKSHKYSATYERNANTCLFPYYHNGALGMLPLYYLP